MTNLYLLSEEPQERCGCEDLCSKKMEKWCGQGRRNLGLRELPRTGKRGIWLPGLTSGKHEAVYEMVDVSFGER